MSGAGRSADVSPRTRSAKAKISREWIITATIDIMRQDGLSAATMRRVAQALDTGPSSLYVYFANTTELHAAVLDELMATVDLRRRGTADSRARRLVADYRDLLLTNPGLARSALALRPSGPNTMRFLDVLLSLLVEVGLPDGQAAWGVDLIVLHATAVAAEHSAPAAADVTDESADRGDRFLTTVASADSDVYPHLGRLAPTLIGGAPSQRWNWALDVLLAGALRTPIPPVRAGRRPTTARKDQS